MPCLFDPRAERVFDEPKALLLRPLASLAAVSLVAWAIAVRRRPSVIASRCRDAKALLFSSAILIAAYVTASMLSIAPRVAWDGAYVRRQGTCTFLGCVACFLAVLFVAPSRDRFGRLSQTMLVASVFPAVYAICQYVGFDIASWNNPTPSRITSTAGNSIFFGGYLIMVWPIALAHGVRFAISRRTSATVAAVALLVAQTAAIAFTGSVGVWVALAAAVAVLLGALLDRLTFTMRIALLVACTAGLGTLAVIATERRPLHAGSPEVSESATSVSRSGEVRLLLWRSGIELLRERPERALVGYGPDTIRWTLGRYEPVAIRRLEGTATADRSHNAVLDTMLTIGLFGLLGHTLVFATICVYAMRRLGWIASRQQAWSLAGSFAFASLVCLASIGRLEHRGALLPLVLPGGLVGGMLLFLVVGGLRTRGVVAWDRDSVLIAALLAGVVGHYVEIQTGIATVTSELYFWLFAGMIAVPEVRPTADRASVRPGANEKSIVLGAASGLVLAVITFDFADRLFDPWAPLALFAILAVAVLTIGAALLPRDDQLVHGRVTTFLATSIGLWLTFVLVSRAWTVFAGGGIDRSDPASTQLIDHAIAQLTALSVTIGLACAVIVGRRADSGARDRWQWMPAVAGSLMLAAAAISLFFSVRALHADELSGMGSAFAQAGDWTRAGQFNNRALALEPDRDVYLARIGQTHIAAFRSGANDRLSQLERASDAYLAARRLSPYDPDHLLQLAMIESLRADADAERSPDHLAAASDDLAAAARLAPRDPDVWSAWGRIQLRRHDFSTALTSLERSVGLDDRSADNHLLYADALLGAGLDERALREYERSDTLAAGRSLPAVSGKALALVKLHRVQEAIDANKQALRIAPRDYTSRKNLALLYEQVGDLPRALSFALDAASVADPFEKAALDVFINELRVRLRKKPMSR